MNAQKYFEQHAEELIASYAGKNVVLFFRGFVPANVRWLAHREDAVLPAGKILNEDGSISIAKIDVAKRKLVQSLMMQEEGVTVGIYEEMLAILQNVQDPKEMFDAEFIVVDNNCLPCLCAQLHPGRGRRSAVQSVRERKDRVWFCGSYSQLLCSRPHTG